jgi:hypothetical protein
MDQETKQVGRRPKLSAEDIAICVDALTNGNSTPRELGIRFDVHPTTIRSACRELLGEIPVGRQKRTSVEIPENMRQIPGSDDYFADDQGNIHSRRQGYYLKKLTPTVCGNVNKVAVIANGKHISRQQPVHDLVCMAWHGAKPSFSHIVGFTDGNMSNCLPANLYWTTQTVPRNIRAAKGEAHGRAKLTAADVLEIIDRHSNGEHISNIARDKNVHPTTVTGIITGRLWSHVSQPTN